MPSVGSPVLPKEQTVAPETQPDATAESAPGRQTQRTRRPSPRVSTAKLLLALTLIPLIGASWFALDHYRGATASNDLADAVQVDADELVQLTKLRAAVHDERNWRSTMTGLEVTGIPLPALEAITGIAFSTEEAAAIDRVDALLATGDYPDVSDSIQALRDEDVSTRASDITGYSALERSVGADSDILLNRLVAAAGDVDNGSRFLSSLRALESTVQMRDSFAYQLSFYFTAQFDDETTAADDTAELIKEIAHFEAADNDLLNITERTGVVWEQRVAIAASPDGERFSEAVAELITDAFAGNVTVDGTEYDGGFPDITKITETFRSGNRLANAHLSLVDTAATEVTRSSAAATDSASQETGRAFQTIAGLVFLSVVFAALLARFIVRPLKNLASAATNLRDGETGMRSQLRGPGEVQAAAAALNEAAGHLHLAQRQAIALAEGDLTHAALKETAPGALGASLQSAVQTLTSSLSEREEFRRRLAHETTHDTLTGLPNRNTCLTQLERSLARSKRSESTVAVLSIDIDQFSVVNDTHGHPAGDLALRTIARQLVGAVRAGDQVGRLGADEFLVIAEPVTGISEAISLARRIADAIAEPVTVGGVELELTVTIGIATAENGTLTADEMLRDADLAVHKSKSSGPGRVEVCDEDLRTELIQLADLQTSLSRAIDDDELTLFFQPIVRSVDQFISGFEALVRWDRPGSGIASPADFIPSAERSDLIIDIDCWVLRAAAQQLREWSSNDRFNDKSISVNVSGRHLSAPDFVANVTGPIDELGVDPTLLIIEVTESALLDDLGEAANRLQELRARGIRIAIDDFGTGYTSLAHLKTLPIDILKIDQSFTNDPQGVSLLQLIIDTGHLLGASITAEGIETAASAAELTRLGSDSLQGYWFARPVPVGELALSIGQGMSNVS